MEKLTDFVTKAREKGISDESIRKNLELEGWKKEKIDIALADIEVPKPDTISTPSPQKSAQIDANLFSLSPLMAALHHVILWFFISSSTITIGGTVAALYGVNISSNVLASMIAVTLITFIPYAILFIVFWAKTRKNPLLIPGKVWSIITICLNSIGAMTAAIVVVINLIIGGDKIYLVSAALILTLDLLVVIAYLFAAFGVHRALKLRMVVISLYLPLLIAMFSILFGMSLMKLGPAKHDENLRIDLSAAVTKIRSETNENKKLPDSLSGFSAIRYEKTDTKTYKVCANFQTSNSANIGGVSYYYTRDAANETVSDLYVSESSFYNTKDGENCFGFLSYYLEEQETSNLYY